MLKIVAGKYRSRIIEAPSSLTIPTKSVVRTAIGNALSQKIPGSSTLDLFAGSGALGIECLSRGAKHCVFVDSSIEAVKTIQGNLLRLGEAEGEVIHSDFKDFLLTNASLYDVILIDPPYKSLSFYEESVSLIIKRHLLSEGGVIMLEYENELCFDEKPFARVKRYKHGRSGFALLWK